jgi:hypothetical protein
MEAAKQAHEAFQAFMSADDNVIAEQPFERQLGGILGLSVSQLRFALSLFASVILAGGIRLLRNPTGAARIARRRLLQARASTWSCRNLPSPLRPDPPLPLANPCSTAYICATHRPSARVLPVRVQRAASGADGGRLLRGAAVCTAPRRHPRVAHRLPVPHLLVS